VHIARDWFERLPPMSDDENYLLEISAHRNAESRLSCQLRVDATMDGLEARIAAEDL
jgi:2Fe-2S ferredoxin